MQGFPAHFEPFRQVLPLRVSNHLIGNGRALGQRHAFEKALKPDTRATLNFPGLSSNTPRRHESEAKNATTRAVFALISASGPNRFGGWSAARKHAALSVLFPP